MLVEKDERISPLCSEVAIKTGTMYCKYCVYWALCNSGKARCPFFIYECNIVQHLKLIGLPPYNDERQQPYWGD